MTDFGSDYVALITCAVPTPQRRPGTVVAGQRLSGVPVGTIESMLRLGQACEACLYDGDILDKGSITADA